MPSKTLHFPSPRHLHSLYAGREENLAHAERADVVRHPLVKKIIEACATYRNPIASENGTEEKR